jgi:hypothetical protein
MSKREAERSCEYLLSVSDDRVTEGVAGKCREYLCGIILTASILLYGEGTGQCDFLRSLRQYSFLQSGYNVRYCSYRKGCREFLLLLETV